MSHIFNKNKFFEDLNARIDKPIDYNHLLSAIIAEILDALEESEIFFIDGIGYHYDPTRDKFLSIGQKYLTASAYGETITDRALKIGNVPTQGAQGVRMQRNGTIIGMSAKSRSTGTYYVEVRKNGIPVTLVSMEVLLGATHSNSIDIDFNEGDHLQIYLDGSNVEHPIVEAEIAWRIAPPV